MTNSSHTALHCGKCWLRKVLLSPVTWLLSEHLPLGCLTILPAGQQEAGKFLRFTKAPAAKERHSTCSLWLFARKGRELICRRCCNERRQTKWLQQQKSVVSQFWRPEAWDPAVSRARPFSGREGESVPELSPSPCWFAGGLWCCLTCRCLTLISAFIFKCGHLLLCPNFLFLWGHSHIGLELLLMTVTLTDQLQRPHF